MGTRDSDTCLQKVGPDEPIFVLRAQDSLAANIVRAWADRASANGCRAEKVEEALAIADAMDAWPVHKMPD